MSRYLTSSKILIAFVLLNLCYVPHLSFATTAISKTKNSKSSKPQAHVKPRTHNPKSQKAVTKTELSSFLNLSSREDRFHLVMQVFASAKNRGALYLMMKPRMTQADYDHMLFRAKQYGYVLNEPVSIEYIKNKRAFRIDKQPELYYVSANGQAIRHNNKIYKFDSELGVEGTLDQIRQTYTSSKKTAWFNGLMVSEAHAQNEYSQRSHYATMDIMLLLNYLHSEWNGDTDFYSVLYHLSQREPEVLNAIKRLYDGKKKIKSIECKDNSEFLQITYEDGTVGNVRWNGEQGLGVAKASISEKQFRDDSKTSFDWHPLYMGETRNNQALTGQFFFCQMMGGGSDPARQLAVVKGLNEMIAPLDYEDYNMQSDSSTEAGLGAYGVD